MTSSKPWGSIPSLHNSSQFMKSSNVDPSGNIGRPVPVLPPRPVTPRIHSNEIPYSYSSYNSPYAPYGNFGTPYRSPFYGSYRSSYGDFNNYGMYDYSGYSRDDYERRFIQSAEESSRQTFASIESVVRAFNSLAMMLDNTFFAMTSSFRAILGVAENFGRLRTMFGDIWYSVNILRFFTWLYRKIRFLLGFNVSQTSTNLAWKEAAHNTAGVNGGSAPSGSNWPTLAFLGVIVSAPYIISKFLPKYEDKLNPANWKAPGIIAKACFDFIATSPNELTLHTNDNIILAPTYLQEEMNLRNTGWAYAVKNGKSGVIPLNYIIINKNGSLVLDTPSVYKSKVKAKDEVETGSTKNGTKRVSFGDIQIFESDDSPLSRDNLPAKTISASKNTETDA